MTLSHTAAAKVAQLRAQLEMKRHQSEALKVRAGMDGVLQRLGDPTNPLQIGQTVSAGIVSGLQTFAK